MVGAARGKSAGGVFRRSNGGVFARGVHYLAGFDACPAACVELADSTLIFAGRFTMYNNEAHPGIIALTQEGEVVEELTPTGFGFTLNYFSDPDYWTISNVNPSLILDGDKLYWLGERSYYNGVYVDHLCRLNTVDLSLDTSFVPLNLRLGPKTGVDINGIGLLKGITIQADRKLIVYGCFSVYGGTFVNSAIRLNLDGSLDTLFLVPTRLQNSIEPPYTDHPNPTYDLVEFKFIKQLTNLNFIAAQELGSYMDDILYYFSGTTILSSLLEGARRWTAYDPYNSTGFSGAYQAPSGAVYVYGAFDGLLTSPAVDKIAPSSPHWAPGIYKFSADMVPDLSFRTNMKISNNGLSWFLETVVVPQYLMPAVSHVCMLADGVLCLAGRFNCFGSSGGVTLNGLALLDETGLFSAEQPYVTQGFIEVGHADTDYSYPASVAILQPDSNYARWLIAANIKKYNGNYYRYVLRILNSGLPSSSWPKTKA